jgi:hypothetical protein
MSANTYGTTGPVASFGAPAAEDGQAAGIARFSSAV